MELLSYLRQPAFLVVIIIFITLLVIYGDKETREASGKGKLLTGLAISGLLGLIWLGSSIYKGFS